MNFCSNCGNKVVSRIPAGDDKPRFVCDDCGTIHYKNPLMVIGSIPEWEDRILLCKRAIEPRLGYWTLPAGFMELGESTSEGAARETTEEAGAQFIMEDLFTVMSVPRVGQVHLYYLARLTSDVFDPGHETMEARLFKEEEIPWDELAFRTVKETLEHYFADRRAGHFGTHAFDIA